MTFRINREADQWFGNIKKKMDYDLDYYYLCLMIGFAANKKEEVDNAVDKIDYYPSKYNGSDKLITACMLMMESEKMGIDLSKRDSAIRNLDKYLEAKSPTDLSKDIGFKTMNEYASGGFDYLRQKFKKPPNFLGEFLIEYINLFRKTIKENKIISEN